MNGTQGSSQLGTALTVVCIVAVFVAATIFAIRSGRKHEKAIRELAKAQGWGFARNETQEHTAQVEGLFPEEKFNLGYVMTVESGRRKLFLLDGTYGNRAGRYGGHLVSVCLVDSSQFRSVSSPVEIISRTWTDEKLLRGQVDMGDSEFARNFIVLSKDQASARQTVNDSVQAVLLAHLHKPLYNPVRIGLGTGRAVLLTGYIAEPERWLDLVDLGRQIESAAR
jgi:hypothetical protein